MGNVEVTEFHVFSIWISRFAELLVFFHGRCTLFLLRMHLHHDYWTGYCGISDCQQLGSFNRNVSKSTSLKSAVSWVESCFGRGETLGNLTFESFILYSSFWDVFWYILFFFIRFPAWVGVWLSVSLVDSLSQSVLWLICSAWLASNEKWRACASAWHGRFGLENLGSKVFTTYLFQQKQCRGLNTHCIN